jgi:hypothetical protein
MTSLDYQFLALCVIALGVWGWTVRQGKDVSRMDEPK